MEVGVTIKTFILFSVWWWCEDSWTKLDFSDINYLLLCQNNTSDLLSLEV